MPDDVISGDLKEHLDRYYRRRHGSIEKAQLGKDHTGTFARITFADGMEVRFNLAWRRVTAWK